MPTILPQALDSERCDFFSRYVLQPLGVVEWTITTSDMTARRRAQR